MVKEMLLKRSGLLLALVVAAGAWMPAPLLAQEEESLPALARDLAAFDQKSRSQIGVCVARVSDGRQLLAHHAEQLFMPASNMKLVTSCFALARLGGEFGFATTLYTSGDDVLIEGNFDPTLGDPVVAEATGKTIYAEIDLWAKALKEKLGSRPAGNLTVITRGGDYRHADWPRDQANRWYCAPIAELNFNNNCIDVRFGMKDGQLTPILSPQSRYIQLVNSAKAGSKQLWTLRANRDCSQVSVSGTAAVNTGDPISVAIDNPPMLLARVVADRLELAGVKVQGQIAASADRTLLARAKPLIQTSTPLSLVMGRANKRSVNVIAEGIFLRAGDGTFQGSARLEEQTLREVYGLPEKELLVSDGSGFSRKNQVSPRAMVHLLTAVLKRRDCKVLLESLPVSGVDGTMSKRLGEAPYRGRVLAKTGYIAGVSCLSGYVLGKDLRPAMAYSVLVNKCVDLTQARQMEENVCRALVDYVDGRQAGSRPVGTAPTKRK